LVVDEAKVGVLGALPLSYTGECLLLY